MSRRADPGIAARELAREALGHGAMQKEEELSELIELLASREIRCAVEIGTARGGTLYTLARLAVDGALLVSIDLPGGPFGGGYDESDIERFRSFAKPGQRLEFLQADSHAESTLETLREILAGRAVDLLLIDGDHTYYGARRDFEMYAPLVGAEGVVVLHDVLPHPEMPECKVDVLWRELRERYPHQEFLHEDDDRGWGQWGGIGVLFDVAAVGVAADQEGAGTALGALVADVARAREEAHAATATAAAHAQEVEEGRRRLADVEAALERIQQALDAQLAEARAAAEAAERELSRALDVATERTRERDEARLQINASASRVDADLRRELARLESVIALMTDSKGWRALEAARRARARALRTAGRVAAATPVPVRTGAERRQSPGAAFAGAAGSDIVFREAVDPVVSVVIPAFNNVAVTLRCLRSLADRTRHELMEVIVVDDVSTDATPIALAQTEGVRVLTNPQNVGFLQTCNHGASVARGRYVLFLNNDVEVEPGWLDALLDAAESAPDIGAVGSKLVYPDGSLQEAGCFVWSDGNAWNFGKGDAPDAPEFNYRRAVDYCSGAALMVRRDLFERLGGLDVRYSPIYYEETDLCFGLRKLGFRVVYVPESVVVHHEGLTHGTDDKPGVGGSAFTKTSQYRNRHLFAVKWKDELARQRPPGTASGYLGGRIDRRPRVLVVDTWVPAHDRDSGSLRMTWILRLLRSTGCAVTLFTTDRRRTEPYTSQLQSAGVEVHYGPLSFTQFAEQRARLFDLVVLSRPYVAEPVLDDVGRHFPDAVVAYDMVDAHFLRESRKAAVLGGEAADEAEALRATEFTCVARADATIAVTSDEAELVRRDAPGARVVVLPNVHEAAADVPTFDERADLLFIGGYRHDPNVDAARYLVHEILPRVRELVDCRVTLLGSEPPAEVRALESEHVVVPGYVQDVTADFHRARVFVAPLRYGAGMKGKIGHALALGLPVVTTPVGVEGMDLADGRHALVADDADALADAVVRAYTDRALWERLSREGVAVVRERWTPDRMRDRLEAMLLELKPRGYEHVTGRRPA